MSDSRAGFSSGIEYRAVTPGWQAIIKNGDGTATKVWGPTREAAAERIVEYLEANLT